VRTHKRDGCEADGGQELTCQSVVAGCDATKVLEASEHALDRIAVPIEPRREAVLPESIARAVDERRIRPAATRLQHMHNAADDPAIIHSGFPASVGRQMRCKPRELTAIQPEMIFDPLQVPLRELESENALVGKSGPWGRWGPTHRPFFRVGLLYAFLRRRRRRSIPRPASAVPNSASDAGSGIG